MENKMMSWSLSLMGLVMMFLVANSSRLSTHANDITCREAITKLLPCEPYLTGSDPPTPSVSCCLACQEILHEANTTVIRRNLCECFKKAAIEAKVNLERARKLPELCKLEGLNIPIDPNVDCNT
ncbi:Lipid transfer protein/Par allergen [Parasponia andersonii]|uniref:Lipid transfer protein/Par allergen n=1 Tax=Parasponia andersonii TaxID=3476 RepID=A0A2P5BTQ8_PARAD|nr:Lipid transfer protein/Par allergen [Parasponia andersonii]